MIASAIVNHLLEDDDIDPAQYVAGLKGIGDKVKVKQSTGKWEYTTLGKWNEVGYPRGVFDFNGRSVLLSWKDVYEVDRLGDEDPEKRMYRVYVWNKNTRQREPHHFPGTTLIAAPTR